MVFSSGLRTETVSENEKRAAGRRRNPQAGRPRYGRLKAVFRYALRTELRRDGGQYVHYAPAI